MGLQVKGFIEAIRNEALGFGFADPWRHTESSITCVVPLIRKTDRPTTYMTLAEAQETGLVEVTDTGTINQTEIVNNGELPVFIRVGEIFKGETQERSATISRLIMPNVKSNIDVACVHATRGIRGGTKLQNYGYVPGRDVRYTSSNIAGSRLDQSESWRRDTQYFSQASQDADWTSEVRTSMKMDDLTSVRDKVSETFKEVLKQVPLHDNQIGMALIDTVGLHSLDCFNIHEPWKAIKEAIAEKESLAIAKKDESGVFDYKPERAKQVIKDAIADGFEEKVLHEHNGAVTMGLIYKKLLGEAVLLNDHVVHLLLARKEDER